MPRKRIAIDFRPVSPPVGVFLSRPSVGLAISPLLHIEDIYWLFLFFSSFFLGPPSRQELHLCSLHPTPGPGTSAG